MGKHTPAPWGSRAEESGNYEVKDEAGVWVARVHFRNGPADETARANAALIAAAPELLEAAKEALEELEAHFGGAVDQDELEASLLGRVRAAIAKAEARP